MYNLHVTAHTPVGVFQGMLNGEPASDEDITQTRDVLQKRLNSMDFMVLYGEEGAEITLAGDVLKNSVLTFVIREA